MRAIICLFAITLFTAESCNNEKVSDQGQGEPIILFKATSMNWTAGIKGGGSGREYTFTVGVASDVPVSINAVSINDIDQQFVLIKQGASVSNEELIIAQGDTLDIRVSISGEELEKEFERAIISYALNDKASGLRIDQIEQLEPQNRP